MKKIVSAFTIIWCFDKVKNEKYRLRQGCDYQLESKSPKEMVEQIHRDMIILDEYALNTLFEAEGAAGKVVRPLYSMITAIIKYSMKPFSPDGSLAASPLTALSHSVLVVGTVHKHLRRGELEYDAAPGLYLCLQKTLDKHLKSSNF